MVGPFLKSFCSFGFLGAFVPAAALAYQIAPRRMRPWVLLAASYSCFWLISGKLVLLLAATTLIAYLAGLTLGRLDDMRRAATSCIASRFERRAVKARFRTYMRLAVALSACVSIGILVTVKYFGFLGSIAQGIAASAGLDWSFTPLRIGVPVGISFYTLQALSYLFDVYRASVPPERNLMRFALYLSFFPQLMEGPIPRYRETSAQLAQGDPIRVENLIDGTLRIAWGAAKILIVADRVNLFVKPVFQDFEAWGGTVIAFGAILSTLQLYCDFSGTIDIVLGVGRIFGVRLPENFRQPFFSRTASEFWQRWHITLGGWLRDYVFYPISLSGPVKNFARMARSRFGTRTGSTLSGGVALLVVWTINGIWHGSGWQYLLFGMYYFVIILLSGLMEPVFARARKALHINTQARPWIVFQILRTTCIVFMGELIFRAEGVRAAISMLERVATDFSMTALIDGSLLMPGMDGHDFMVVALFVLVMFLHSLWRERGGVIPEPVARHRAALVCSALTVILLATVILGAYGQGYIPLDPIYAQF